MIDVFVTSLPLAAPELGHDGQLSLLSGRAEGCSSSRFSAVFVQRGWGLSRDVAIPPVRHLRCSDGQLATRFRDNVLDSFR